jgi:hypothetical protein
VSPTAATVAVAARRARREVITMLSILAP